METFVLGGVDFGVGLLKLGHRMMPPLVDFREPTQAATEAHLAWWHLRMTLVRSRYFRKQQLERVSIRCRVDDEDGAMQEISDLRWQSRDSQWGESLTTLEYGRVSFVPFVMRDETDGHTIVTDDGFLMRREQRIALNPGHYSVKFIIKAGATEHSSDPFVLQVPQIGNSNGSFLFERYYGDEA